MQAAADAAGTTRAEWTRAALLAAVHPPGVEEHPDYQALQAALEAAETTAATATGEAERLRHDLAAAAQALLEKREEVAWLRGEVAKLNDKLTPAALPRPGVIERLGAWLGGGHRA